LSKENAKKLLLQIEFFQASRMSERERITLVALRNLMV
jgi:hypothetical protein